MAEGILRHQTQAVGLNWEIASAAIEDYHIGKPPHYYSQQACLRHGIDISSQRARLFQRQDFEYYDRIYAMAEDIYQYLQTMESTATRPALFLDTIFPGENRSVPDPWYGDESGYEPVFTLIEQGCTKMLESYHTTGGDLA